MTIHQHKILESLPEDQVAILDLLSEGVQIVHLSTYLYMSRSSCAELLSKLRIALDVKTTKQLIALYIQYKNPKIKVLLYSSGGDNEVYWLSI